jgi:hypothetical protein
VEDRRSGRCGAPDGDRRHRFTGQHLGSELLCSGGGRSRRVESQQ